MSAEGLRAGDLKRQITIEQRATGTDTNGQRSTTWSTFCTTFASISPMSGRELELAQAVNAEVTHQIVIRYRTGVTTAMRVVYQGRYFDIQSVQDVDTQHRKLVLLCGEGLNVG
jgi:SPP1 family predicted phage head-tail adaptor